MKKRTRALVRHAVLSLGGSLPRRPRGGPIRIFCGHHMEASHAENFRRILRLLRESYEIVPLSRAVELARSPAPPPGRFAALTFDDGFLDNYEHIAAILEQFDAPACFFVATNFIGCEEPYRLRFLSDRVHQPPSKQPMSWAMLEDLLRRGFEVGAHTADHVNLSLIPPEVARAQMLESKRAVEDRLGSPCHFFAWPYGGEGDCPAPLLEFARGHFTAAFSATRRRTIVDRGGFVLHRDHFEPSWPASHVRFFL